MNYIVQLFSTLVQRLPGWFGEVLKRRPEVLGTLVTRLRSAGEVVGSSATDIVRWAQQSPTNMSLFVTMAAAAGATGLETLLKPANGKSTPEQQELIEKLKSISGEGGVSVSAGSSCSALGDPEELRDLLTWARGHYGTAEDAITAHDKAQRFQALDPMRVRAGYRLLRL